MATNPIRLLRAPGLGGLRDLGPIHEWSEGRASLALDAVEHGGRRGAVMCYTNPPVHQIGNPGLDAMLAALARLAERGDVEFLILTWPCDPVHAGGDLKESLDRLTATHLRRDELVAAGAPRAEIDALYAWADGRLDKGQALYRAVRALRMRTVGVCGGGLRFGGSAEVNLMADLLVGDSRSGMCFSEAMIGLIPGWAGVARAVTKAGAANARWMAQTAAQVMTPDLARIGIYDAVVTIDEPLPRMGRSGDKAADAARYADDLAAHDGRVWPALLAEGLRLATCAPDDVPRIDPGTRPLLATAEQLGAEVRRRADPSTYAAVWGQTLKEAEPALARIGRPLAPQSVAELDALFGSAETGGFDEDRFVEAEKLADARLYRDRRLEVGIRATLEQRVADFRTIG
jgi:enoyl-CoA hydratase/carnithine racemase